MIRQTRSKPQSKGQPYTKEPSKNSRQPKKKSSANGSNAQELSNDTQPSTSGVSVVSELTELKKSINAMSNMLGTFLTTMSSLVTNVNNEKDVNSGSVVNSQNSVVNQPQSVNILDANLGHGSGNNSVSMHGQPESDIIDQDQINTNVESNSRGMQGSDTLSPEQLLEQAVNQHIATVTDVAHHPPGKRFQVIGRLLDRRINEKIKKEIWENKYIDLHLLLPQDDKEEVSPILAPGKPGEPARWQEPQISKGKLAIDEWCQAFCVYISVYTRKYTEATPARMAYYNKIQNLASKGGNFLFYDQEFRLAREQDGIAWDIPLLDLWMECLPLQQVKSEQTSSYKGFNSNVQSSSNFRSSKSSSKNNKNQFHHPKGYCYQFHNTGKCPMGQECRYSHQCWVPQCQGKHPVFKCYKLKPSTNTNSSKSEGNTIPSTVNKTTNPSKK